MRQQLNENDQIRNMLGKIRIIKEDTMNANPQGQMGQPGQMQQRPTQTPAGEKMRFDDINTVGFLNGNVREDIKNNVKTAVGAFIKASGLLLDAVTITVENQKLIISSDTIKNPGMDVVKSVIFDTDSESPQFEFVGGKLDITKDFTNLIQTISRTFDDQQIGKTALITATEGNIK